MSMFFGLFLVMVMLVIHANGNVCLKIPSGLLIKSSRVEGYAFYIFRCAGSAECARRCMARTKCKSFNYDIHTNHCELNSVNSSTVFTVVDDTYVFSDISEWSRELIGLCADVICPDNNRCVSLANGKQICIRTECEDPPAMQNGNIQMSLRCVGCSISYECLEGFAGTGDPSITCLRNGDWTATTYQCEKVCRSGWILLGDSCYLFSQQTMAFDDAYDNCIAKGGYLAIIDTSEENTAVCNAATSYYGPSIARTQPILFGATDNELEDDWRWEYSGDRLVYFNWAPNEPGGKRRENCVKLYSVSQVWVDIMCTQRCNFVCEA